jgi:uncharacterized protein (DUF2252 family)
LFAGNRPLGLAFLTVAFLLGAFLVGAFLAEALVAAEAFFGAGDFFATARAMSAGVASTSLGSAAASMAVVGAFLAAFFTAAFFTAAFSAAAFLTGAVCGGAFFAAVFLAGAFFAAWRATGWTGSPWSLLDVSAGTAWAARPLEAPAEPAVSGRACPEDFSARCCGVFVPGSREATAPAAVRDTWSATLLPRATVPRACSAAFPAVPSGSLMVSRAASLIFPSGFFRATAGSLRVVGQVCLESSTAARTGAPCLVHTHAPPAAHKRSALGEPDRRAMRHTPSMADQSRDRTAVIIEVLGDAFAPLMAADPVAFRGKYRTMAADPHAFYRGTACLYYADVTADEDPFCDDRSGRIWVHGDLHVENFGTYLNSDGRLVFDINDFDEAYLGRFTWDLQRFAASLALVGWQKALPEEDVRRLVARYARSYLSQIDDYRRSDDDDYALHLDNTDGPIHHALLTARLRRRADLLDGLTVVTDGTRMFRDDAGVRHLGKRERAKVVAAFGRYLDSIPEEKRFDRSLFYDLRDVVGKSGFGIGSAGLPAYNLLVEGFSQALDNDVVLSMKQANVPAVSRFVDTAEVDRYFDNEGHRTVVSQRALQVHTDPLLGYTDLDGVGYVVSELSPYEVDLDWSVLTEPDDIAGVVDLLGRATARIHCASDEDSDQDLVDFQVEDAIAASLDRRRKEFVSWLTDFALSYADRVRDDHALFVAAFREGRIGVSAT